jgi:hypothetical protein
MRRSSLALAAVAALAAVPAALAWTTLTAGVQNTVVPSMIVTKAGTLLVSFETPSPGAISVSRNRGTPKIVVGSDPVPGRTQLVQQPSGAIQLYYPNALGVARLTSTDDGQTWSAPTQTQSHATGPVMGAAVAPDGTPYFAQDSTAGINVFRGLNGETVRNVFPRCCGYAESLAVDTSGLAQIAFYSNADPDGTFLYERLGPDLNPGGSTALKPTAAHTDRVPLVTDSIGNTFMAWPPGSPEAAGLTVVPFRNGQPAGDGVNFRGPFTGGDPHMALTLDSADRLWIVWTGGGLVHVARSRSHGQHFGATVSTPLTDSLYQISAAALPGEPGSVDVIVNNGSSLIENQLPPGLTVKVTRTVKTVGKTRVVSRWAQALDDGFVVSSATFFVKGRRYHANAAGKAKVPVGQGKASAPGYAGASFRAR